MSVEINLSSPQRRSNSQTAFTSATYSKKPTPGNEFESFSVLFQRHRYLLTALGLLTFLCIVYLYFAVTLGANIDSCSGLSGVQKASCLLKRAKVSSAQGKLKLF